MPPQETDFRTTKVIYWAKSGDDDYGEPTVSTGIELEVRIEEGNAEILDPGGNSIGTDLSLILKQDVLVNSIIWIGTEDDLPDDLTTLTDLYTIVGFIKVPDVKGIDYYREAQLKRHSDTLPTVS